MTKRFTKKVKKQVVSPAQADVLQGISNFLTIKNIAKYRKTSVVAVYKIINTLLKKGLIEKISRGIYGLTNSGKEGLHSLIGFTNNLRQHNLAIKVEILESPRNWEQKRSKIMTLPYFNKRIQLKNNSYDLLSYGNLQLKITSRSVIFRLPTIYSRTVDDCVLQAMDLLFNAIPKVESKLNVKLTKNYKSNIIIISQEYARLSDSLAKLYNQEGTKLYITDEEGKVWLIADYSFSVNELETISPDTADEDMRAVNKFMNDLRKHPTTFSEVKDTAHKIQQNQLLFSQNINTHIKAIQDLGEGVQRLTLLIEKMEGRK